MVPCERSPAYFVEIVPAHYDGGMSMLPAEDYLAGPANLAIALGMRATVACLPRGRTGLAFCGPRVLDARVGIVTLASWPAYLLFLWQHRDAVLYANFRGAAALAAALFARRSVLVGHAALPCARWKRRLLGRVLRRFTVLRALTEAERDQLLALGLGARVALVPLAIDWRFFAEPESFAGIAALRSALDLGGARVALCVANVRRLKRVDTMLRAIARLGRAGTSIKLVVAGADRLPAEGLPGVHEMARALGIAERVVLTGFVEPAVVRRLLYLADAFVNSSQDEAQCLAACEAAAAGRPLCLADVPSLRSAFPGALFHAPDDDAALAANLARVLAGGYPQAVRDREQQRVSERCDPDRVRAALAQLLLGDTYPAAGREESRAKTWRRQDGCG